MSVGRLPDDGRWRRPTCSPRCRRLLVQVIGERSARYWDEHNLDDHEETARAEHGLAAAIAFGRLIVEPKMMAAYIDGRQLCLSPIESGLLVYLARHAGSVCRYADILRQIWGPEYATATVRLSGGVKRGSQEDHLVRVHIARLRRKLGADRNLIQTTAGQGYWMPAIGNDGAVVIPPYAPQPARGEPRFWIANDLLRCLKSANGGWVSEWTLYAACRRPDRLCGPRKNGEIRVALERLIVRNSRIEVQRQGARVVVARLRPETDEMP